MARRWHLIPEMGFEGWVDRGGIDASPGSGEPARRRLKGPVSESFGLAAGSQDGLSGGLISEIERSQIGLDKGLLGPGADGFANCIGGQRQQFGSA